MEFEIRTTKKIMVPKGKPIFDEYVTEVEIQDEVGGEFISVKQLTDTSHDSEIRIEKTEWPVMRELIETMLMECRSDEDRSS